MFFVLSSFSNAGEFSDQYFQELIESCDSTSQAYSSIHPSGVSIIWISITVSALVIMNWFENSPFKKLDV